VQLWLVLKELIYYGHYSVLGPLLKAIIYVETATC